MKRSLASTFAYFNVEELLELINHGGGGVKEFISSLPTRIILRPAGGKYLTSLKLKGISLRKLN